MLLCDSLKLNLYPWPALLQRHATSYEGAWEKVNLFNKLSILYNSTIVWGFSGRLLRCTTNNPCLLIFAYQCNILFLWVWARPSDFLLKNRLGQKWEDAPYLIGYKRLWCSFFCSLAYLLWSPLPTLKEMLYGEIHVARNKGGPWPTAQWGNESCQQSCEWARKWILPPQAFRCAASPVNSLVIDLWEIHLSCSCVPDPLCDNKGCLELLRFEIIYYAIDN